MLHKLHVKNYLKYKVIGRFHTFNKAKRTVECTSSRVEPRRYILSWYILPAVTLTNTGSIERLCAPISHLFHLTSQFLHPKKGHLMLPTGHVGPPPCSFPSAPCCLPRQAWPLTKQAWEGFSFHNHLLICPSLFLMCAVVLGSHASASFILHRVCSS